MTNINIEEIPITNAYADGVYPYNLLACIGMIAITDIPISAIKVDKLNNALKKLLIDKNDSKFEACMLYFDRCRSYSDIAIDMHISRASATNKVYDSIRILRNEYSKGVVTEIIYGIEQKITVDSNLINLNLPKLLYNSLSRAGIKTIQQAIDMVKTNPKDWQVRIRNVSFKGKIVLESKLAEMGFIEIEIETGTIAPSGPISYRSPLADINLYPAVLRKMQMAGIKTVEDGLTLISNPNWSNDMGGVGEFTREYFEMKLKITRYEIESGINIME